MEILRIIILLSCVGISYSVAQRRQQNAGEAQSDTVSSLVTTRGRGRARFVKTPEFEQVSSDYVAAARSTASDRRSEGKSRFLAPGTRRRSRIGSSSITTSPSSTRRVYEVEKIVDDIPDTRRSPVYHHPRVITEDKFELPNAPRSSFLEAEQKTGGQPLPVDELIKNFGSLKSDQPIKIELPRILPQIDNDTEEGLPSLSSTTNKLESVEVSSSTTEKEMESELLKNQAPSTKGPESTTVDVTNTTDAHARRTVIRTRTNAQRQSTEAPVSSSSSVRSRGGFRSRQSVTSRDSTDTASRRLETVESAPESTTARGGFRIGRRRPTQNQKDKGPSLIEEDSLSPKTRTGRDSSNYSITSRRGSVRNVTPRPTVPGTVEATTRIRADIRRSRGRKIDTSQAIQSTEAPTNPNRATEFAGRRTRTRGQTNPQSVQEPAGIALPLRPSGRAEVRSFQESHRSRTAQVEQPTGPASIRDNRARTRSRFQISDLENIKLEPQPSIEYSTRSLPRRTGRTRSPTLQVEELIASSTVENPIRVTSPPTSTIRSVNAIPTRVKESVHSEISEVISSRKVTRRKKPEAKTANKKSSEEEDIDDLNYPPQFKAIILANKSNEKKPDSAALNVSTNSTTSTSEASSTDSTSTTSTMVLPPVATSTLFPSMHVEDVDNDLASSPRPTRRRFSVSTRKSKPDSSTTRKTNALSARKLSANPDSEKLSKFHARFNSTQYQRNNTHSYDDSVSSTIASTTKRTTKPPTKIAYTRKSDKAVERKFNQQPTKSNRFSSRYRSETRSSVPTRAATTSPVYVPTVPTVTPAGLPYTTNQALKTNDARANTDELDDIKIISIAQPIANSLYSDNLVTENSTTVNASEAANQATGSILERIINSISSIATTTSKPDVKPTSTESAIFKIPPSAKKKEVDRKREQNELTTEKPTTIIERILNSLSAIQANDKNVGNPSLNQNYSSDLDAKLNVSASQKVPNLVSGSPPLSVSSTPPTTTPTTTSATTSTTMMVALAPTNTPTKSTVAISLADYLASLSIAKTRDPSMGETATTTSTSDSASTPMLASSTTIVNENKNTIDYFEVTTAFETSASTTETSAVPTITTTMASTTMLPTTTTMMPTTTFLKITPKSTTTGNWLAKLLGIETSTQMVITTQRLKTVNKMDTTTLNHLQSTAVTPTTDLNTSTESTTSIPTTPIMSVSRNSVTITSPSNVNKQLTDSTNSNNRTGKLLERLVEEINNEITSSKQNNNATNAPISSNSTMSPEDYFIFAVLPNNTIVRKRPRKLTAPYFIYGVYPNNTIIRKFPNGTLVPDDPVVQVSGFDTRDPLPPRPMITSNRVNEPQGTDDARENLEANRLSLELNNDTAILTERTVDEYTGLVNQTITTESSTTESAMSTTPVSVTSTQITTEPEQNEEIISTEMSIDMTTLNIPMIIELGPTTEVNGLIESVTGTSVTNDSTRQLENIASTMIPTSTLDPVDSLDTTTNLDGSKIESRSSFESESIEGLEDITLPMPDTSTVIITSTSTSADTTITPDSSFAWKINPISIRTTTVPTAIDELENEIKNTGTSRVDEVSTTIATSTTSQPTSTIRVTTESFGSTTAPTTRVTTRKPTTTEQTTTTRPTTPMTTTTRTTTPKPTTPRTTTTTPRPTTTTSKAITTTTFISPTTTTDLTTFITNFLSTLRPVYTPTTVAIERTTTETTTAPIVTITARRRTTTTTEPTRTRVVRRRTQPTTTNAPTTESAFITQRTFTDNEVASFDRTTSFSAPSTTLDPTKVDIDEIVRKSKKKLSPEQLAEIEQLKALEREQANLLQQLSLLTNNLNLNGRKPQKPVNYGSGNLANRIVQFAKDRDVITTEIPIYTEIPSTRLPKKLPALDSKGTTVDDILKELNAAQNSLGNGNGGRSQEAVIAEILKQRGIEPSTPKALSEAYKPTTKKPRTTTPRPGRIMQGLNWLFTQFTGPAPAPPAPSPRPRTTRRTTTTQRSEIEELHFEPTELNNVIHTSTMSTLKRPVNSLSDEELSRLITQLEAIQRDPKLAQNLDITPFRKLQSQSTTLNNKNVEIFTTGGSSNQVTRSPKAIGNTRVRTAKSTTSNSIEDLDEVNEVPTARSRGTQAPGSRATLPPVELNHVPGIEDSAQGPQIGDNFLSAAVNVTRAISTFLGAAIQGAARSFQSAIGSGSSSASTLFRASG